MTSILSQPPPVDPRAAREAAQWLTRLHGAVPGIDDHAVWQQWQTWRAADPAHELAWQRAELVMRTLDMVPPAIGTPVLGRPQHGRRASTGMLAALILAGPAALAGYATVRAAPWEDWFADVRTTTGEIRKLVLDDGTRLALNTDTAVAIRFDGGTRLLRLHHGELHVATAADTRAPARPFVVHTASGRLRALGTEFSVRANHGVLAPTARVAVTAGAVEIRPAKAVHVVQVIAAGWQAGFTEHAIGPVTALDAAGASLPAWVNGVLLADDTPLAALVEQLGRYRTGVLRCDPAVVGLRVTGAFQLRDTDNILQLLQRSLPIRISQRTRFWTTLEPR
jgi:transmembrane sensor